jgi:hypothetical protein
LNTGQRCCALRRFELPSELADEIFRRAVVVSQIPGRETCVVIRKHRLNRFAAVNRAVRTRDLPHSVQQAMDLQVRSKLESKVFVMLHVVLLC